MAQVPYGEGVPDVAPRVEAPNDYQQIQTNANQFGAGIGEGLQQLGQGATKASMFFGQAAADDASNNYQDTVTKLLHGDPNKTVTGPDGQPMPDTGYLGLKGRAALDARPGVMSAMDDALKNTRAGLQTPEQQLQFDNFSRRYRSAAVGQIGSHSDEQANSWYGQVNKDTEVLALGHIATNADNPVLAAGGAAELINARTKMAELQGAQPGDSVWQAAVTGGRRDALVAQVNSIGVKDPARAMSILDQNKDIAGVLYDNVANSLRSRAEQQVGEQAGASAVKDATEGVKPVTGHVRANYANTENMGDPSTAGWKEANIVPVAVDGATFDVNKQAAPAFQGFLQDLHAAGYNVKSSGGYNYRNKVGTGQGLSQHAFGNAIDINADVNKQGQGNNDFGNIDVGALAAKHGLIWGGNWSGAQRDPMHFEWAGPNGTGGGSPLQGHAASTLFDHLEQTNSLPSGYLGRTMQLESSGVDKTNASGAAGWFQFTPDTASRMGVDPHNFASSSDGAARLASENAKSLRLGLGHDPSGAELYLAHQQGAGGAVKLLSNPDELAANLVGTRAVVQNGGQQGMTARQFTDMWAQKYNGATPGAVNLHPSMAVQPTATPGVPTVDLLAAGAPGTPAATAPQPTDQTPQVGSGVSSAAQAPVQPMSLKADAYDRVLADPSLSPAERTHALAYVNQTLAAQQIAQDSDERARKRANDDAADKIVQQMYSGDFTGITQSIASNPALDWRTRSALHEMALKESGDDVNKSAQSYGPGFWAAYKQVTAPVGDSDRISDPTEIMRRAGPGGDLTLSGVKELSATLAAGKRSIDDASVNTAKTSMMAYAKGKLSFQDEFPGLPGVPPKKDPVGEAIFNAQFVPKFMGAYDKWTKDGKDPWQFLTQTNVDKMIEGMRPTAQMNADRIAAQNNMLNSVGAGTPGTTPGTTAQPVPAAPAKVNPQAWSSIITTPPTAADGNPVPQAAWAQVLNLLASDPSPGNIKAFNESKYGRGGYDASEILKQFGTQPGTTVPPVTVLEPAERQNAKIRNASAGHVR